MREADPVIATSTEAHSLSIRESNLEQQSACTGCLEVGIHILHSFLR